MRSLSEAPLEIFGEEMNFIKSPRVNVLQELSEGWIESSKSRK